MIGDAASSTSMKRSTLRRIHFANRSSYPEQFRTFRRIDDWRTQVEADQVTREIIRHVYNEQIKILIHEGHRNQSVSKAGRLQHTFFPKLTV